MCRSRGGDTDINSRYQDTWAFEMSESEGYSVTRILTAGIGVVMVSCDAQIWALWRA